MSQELQSNYNDIRNLKYKNTLLSNIPWTEHKSLTDLADLDKFLENEKINNSNEPWSKLDKTSKLKKLTYFAENYKHTNNLNEMEYEQLLLFFRDCLDKKRLQRVKDVNYNKESGEIKDIPGLCFNKISKNFTLKNIDKRVSTLKGLTQKKKYGTVKNINTNTDNSDSE